MAYECRSCGSKNLLALVVVKKFFPMAARQGSIKLSGKIIDQVETKFAWDKEADGVTEKRTKGPIVCGDCEQSHVYHLDGDSLEAVASGVR
jgi:hypothetical protein